MADDKARIRDEKGRFVKQEGKSKLPGKPFVTTDKRASEAGQKSGEARKEKGNLKKLCQIWMETEVPTAKDSNGNPMTGAQLMISVAAGQLARGNPRFWELMRDTAGYKPVDKVMVSEVEQEVIDEVERMVQEASEEEEHNDGSEMQGVRGENSVHQDGEGKDDPG